MSDDLELFADETVELLPERTTMQAGFFQNGNLSIAIAVNAGNINFGGTQVNTALAAALAGANVRFG
ncbi:hypothetical protein ACI8AA_08185 [Geodermatophilus sp. SYSU D01180]